MKKPSMAHVYICAVIWWFFILMPASWQAMIKPLQPWQYVAMAFIFLGRLEYIVYRLKGGTE